MRKNGILVRRGKQTCLMKKQRQEISCRHPFQQNLNFQNYVCKTNSNFKQIIWKLLYWVLSFFYFLITLYTCANIQYVEYCIQPGGKRSSSISIFRINFTSRNNETMQNFQYFAKILNVSRK